MMASTLFQGSAHALLYSKFRPSPPHEFINSIIDFLRNKVPGTFEQAADIGCGSGQSTIVLAPYFEKVTGFDISETQIECARKERSADNVEYKVSDCTKLSFQESSVQLVTSSEAVHWFDTSKLFNEVKRILIPNGVFAIYGYWICLPKTENEEKNKRLADFINEELLEKQLRKYMNEELLPCYYLVKNRYTDIIFPFKDVQRLELTQKSESTLADYIGYIRTWSHYQKLYKEDNEKGEKLLKDVEKQFVDILGQDKTAEDIIFQLHTDIFMLMGYC